jgi:hypothetical protein
MLEMEGLTAMKRQKEPQVNFTLTEKIYREILEWDAEQPHPHKFPAALFRDLAMIGYSVQRESSAAFLRGPSSTGGLPLRAGVGAVNELTESILAILTRHNVVAATEISDNLPLLLVSILATKAKEKAPDIKSGA